MEEPAGSRNKPSPTQFLVLMPVHLYSRSESAQFGRVPRNLARVRIRCAEGASTCRHAVRLRRNATPVFSPGDVLARIRSRRSLTRGSPRPGKSGGEIRAKRHVSLVLQPRSVIVARAALLLECSYFVHCCNKGHWPSWMKFAYPMYRPSGSLPTRGPNTGIRRSHIAQRAAGKMFHQWAEVPAPLCLNEA